MRAAITRNGSIVVDEIADLTPEMGQIRVKTLACGICGSDLHALAHGDEMVELSRASGGGSDDPLSPKVMDLDRDVVFGHEFCAEVLELGPGASNCSEGDLVVSMPVVMAADGIHPVGYSNDYPGGYAEEMLLLDMLALPVPNGLDARRAALTEPMAVGIHAVNKSGITDRAAAVVLGCGPVGLAVIAALGQAGVAPIVAADFSTTRRALAETMGAHEVVDPRVESAMSAWKRVDGSRPLHVFEAVGVPGMIDQAMTDVPRDTEIMVVGVCMQADSFRPFRGIARELTIRFALGYDPTEFATSLRLIAEGEFDVEPLITGVVGLDGVAQAFVDLGDPDAHAKILVEP